jgi:hypothetical protein
MTRPKRPGTPPNDYAVGYGKPPQATRFQPGRSGNPGGHKKAAKSVGALLREALTRRITIQEDGKPRRITLQEVIIRGLVNDAARRDHRALRVLLSLMERYQDTSDSTVNPADFQPEDQAIIEDFLNSFLPPKDASGSEIPKEEKPVSEEKPEAAAGSKKENPHGDD